MPPAGGCPFGKLFKTVSGLGHGQTRLHLLPPQMAVLEIQTNGDTRVSEEAIMRARHSLDDPNMRVSAEAELQGPACESGIPPGGECPLGWCLECRALNACVWVRLYACVSQAVCVGQALCVCVVRLCVWGFRLCWFPSCHLSSGLSLLAVCPE